MKEIGISSMILKTGLDIAKVCIGASVCGLGALYLGQRQLIYPRPNQIYDPKDAGAELLRIKQDESSVVSAAWFPPRDEDIEIFIYFHGNGDQIGAAGSFLATEFKRRYGFGFLAVEYPGYGLAQGQPSEKSIIHTANIALQHCIHELKIEPHRIILFGQSLGTGPALQLACSYHDIIPKLILLSPFTSIPAVAHSVFPFIPLSFLRVAIHDTFANLKFMRSLSAIKRHDKKHPKCLILHGTEDEIVPFTQGQQLAAAGLAPLSSLTSFNLAFVKPK